MHPPSERRVKLKRKLKRDGKKFKKLSQKVWRIKKKSYLCTRLTKEGTRKRKFETLPKGIKRITTALTSAREF